MFPRCRCRLGASPATGLVGMRENSYISDFFGCVGFLPLASESQIREAMVKIMMLAGPQQEAALSTDCYGEEAQFGTLVGWGTWNEASGVPHVPKDPSFATFWAAVALGALAKGSPFEAVEFYSQLAREALTECRSGSTNAELARASAILTYLYSFMGDAVKFREYGELAEHLLETSLEQEAPDKLPGLFSLIQHCKLVGNPQSGATESSRAREEGPLQVNRVANDRDLYLFVAESFREFDQAVITQARQWFSSDLDRFYSCGPSNRKSFPNDPLPGEVSEAIMKVFETTNSLDFEPLQPAADRPSIRSGIGDLLINGTLLFAKAARGDLEAALEKLDRAIGVYERYPGLCRCMMGSHMLHMLLATVAAINDGRARRMYDRLSGIFNSYRAPHTSPMPPLSEWRGMAAICSDLHCRVTGALVTSRHMKAFVALSADSIHDSADLSHAPSDLDEGITIDVVPASAAGGKPGYLAPEAVSGSTWTGSNGTGKWAKIQNCAEAVCCAGPDQAAPASRSYPMSQADTGFVDVRLGNAANKDVHQFSRSPMTVGYNQDLGEPDGDKIAVGDWLEVVDAMSDAIHAE
ncbi:unnamed protein product [Scytosiphon promiscuus]